MGINKINSKSNWGEAAANLNSNFDTLNAAILQIKGATTKNKGYFATSENLFAALPSAKVGDVAFVGTEYPYAVYRWDGIGWAETGEYGGESVDLHEYPTKDELSAELSAQEERINEETDTKISGLVVQETGDGEGVVMSQKAVTEKIGEVKDEISNTDVSLSIRCKDSISLEIDDYKLKVYNEYSIRLPKGLAYNVIATIDEATDSTIYIALLDNEHNQIHSYHIDTDTTSLALSTMYAKQDIGYVRVYKGGSNFPIICLTIQFSNAESNNLKKLAYVERKGSFFGWDAGNVSNTSTPTNTYEIKDFTAKNIHAYLLHNASDVAAIAFVDKDGTFLKEKSIRSVPTNGVGCWFYAETPEGTAKIICTSKSDNDFMPIICTSDNMAKSEEQMFIEDISSGEQNESSLYLRDFGNTPLKFDFFQGYYKEGQFDGTKESVRYWTTTEVMLSSGFVVSVDTDWSLYVVEFFIIDNDLNKVGSTLSSYKEIDLIGVLGWGFQVRKKDYSSLSYLDAYGLVNVSVISGVVRERPMSIEQYKRNIQSFNDGVDSVKSISVDSTRYPTLPPRFYGHLFIDRINANSKPTIPCQSVFDIACTAKLGFKCIELNVIMTSDGVAVTGHQNTVDGVSGYLSTLENLNGEQVNVHIPSTTFSDLRNNYRYKSKYAQYKVPVTSLEEALRACVEYNITPLVQCLDTSVIELVESIMKKNYIAYNAKRSQTDVMISGYPSGDVSSLLNECRTIGAPYFCCVNKASLNSFTDDEIKSLIKGVHELGCTVGWAGCYHSVDENIRYGKLGLDLSASGWEVPDFDNANEVNAIGNSIRGYKDFGIDQVGDLTLSNGASLSLTAEKMSIISKASLHIHYKGNLKFTFGHKISNAEIMSDGTSDVVLTSIIEDMPPSLNITASSDTEIYSISYKVASVI